MSLALGMGNLLLDYLLTKLCSAVPPLSINPGFAFQSDLTEEMRERMEAEIKSEIALAQATSPPSERQEGRSEVIREIARSKPS
jgi:hypothetical protein